MRRHLSRLAWLVAAGLALTAGAHRLAAQPAQNKDEVEAPEITDLALKGVKSVDADALLESISTEESGCKSLVLKFAACWWTKSDRVFKHAYLDREEFARDVLRIRVFYWKRGFREATVDTAVTRSGREKVKVAFTITEGPPTLVHTIRVARPDGILSDKGLSRLMVLKAGEPLDLLQLDSSVTKLEAALWERGYSDAIITDTTVLDTTSRSADILLTIDPKWLTRVGDIIVNGNNRVSERTIRNSMTLKPGSLFQLTELLRSQRNLYESGLFRHASILVPPIGDSIKTLEVTVSEADLRSARVGGGFSTADFVQVDANFTHQNFFGGARRFDVRGTIGNLFAETLHDRFIFRNIRTPDADDPDQLFGMGDAFFRPTWNASISLDQPWFRSPKNSIGASIFAHRRSAPTIYIDRGYGAALTFTREVAVRAPLSATYRFEVTRVEAGDIYYCVNFGVCDNATILAMRDQQNLSPFALTGLVDRTNDAFSPTVGYRARGELEHASAFTGSDFRYNRVAIDGTVFRAFGRRIVLATHARAGYVRGLSSTGDALNLLGEGSGEILHPRKRFYAGGSRSVRGYGENQLGPRILTIAPSDLRGSPTDSVMLCPESIPITECDPNLADVNDFAPRPLGGNAVLEANVEVRFPIWRMIGGVAFLDGALVGSENSLDLGRAAGALTPGLGIRYRSPVGPIRVDVGYRPTSTETLKVVTATDAEGDRAIVQLDTPRRYARNKFTERLTLHLSIGEAF